MIADSPRSYNNVRSTGRHVLNLHENHAKGAQYAGTPCLDSRIDHFAFSSRRNRPAHPRFNETLWLVRSRQPAPPGDPAGGEFRVFPSPWCRGKHLDPFAALPPPPPLPAGGKVLPPTC